MGSLHEVTQLSPFVLSGDGAFLPVVIGREEEVENACRKNLANDNGLLRVPAGTQHSNGTLTIHGMHTNQRELQSPRTGTFLYIEPGGKHGYGFELAEFIEQLSDCLGDFWFFVLWNYEHADEYIQSDGTLNISRSQPLPTSKYDDFFVERLKGQPSLLHAYLFESGLWAKRWYESEAAEVGRSEAGASIEEFPDAIQTLEVALEIIPDHPETLATLEWYNQRLSRLGE